MTAYQNRDVYDQLTDIKLNDPNLVQQIIQTQNWFQNYDYYIDDHRIEKEEPPRFILINRRIGNLNNNAVYYNGWIDPYMGGKYEYYHKYEFKLEADNQLHLLEGSGTSISNRDKTLSPTNRVVTEFYYHTTSILFTVEEFLKLDLNQINYRPIVDVDKTIKLVIPIYKNIYRSNAKSTKSERADRDEKIFDTLSSITKITRLRLILMEEMNKLIRNRSRNIRR